MNEKVWFGNVIYVSRPGASPFSLPAAACDSSGGGEIGSKEVGGDAEGRMVLT